MHVLTAAALRHPVLTAGLFLALTLLAGAGALRLSSETGYRAALGPHHQSVVSLDRFISEFGAGLPVLVAWGCETGEQACADALSDRELEAAERIAASIRPLPGVLAVRTPGATPLLVGAEGRIEAWRLLEVRDDPAKRREFIERARRDPFWQGVLVSEDARSAALAIELKSSDPHRHAAALDALVAAVARERGPYALVGDPVDFAIGGAALNREARRLGGVALVLVTGVVWGLFRTPQAVIPVLAAVLFSALACLGLMGWKRWPENEISQAIVPLLLVIGVCGSIHLLSRYRDLPDTRPRLRGRDLQTRLIAAASDVGWPCCVAALTTAVGLGSFVTSDLLGFVRFGLASAFGCLVALVTTFTLLPVLVHALRIELPRLPETEGFAPMLRAMGLATRRHARSIVVCTAALLVLGAFGLWRLEVDVTKASLMGSGSDIVRWQRWVAAHLRKPDSLELRITPPEDAELADPRVLEVVYDAVRSLEGNPELGRTRSILDGIAQANQLLHEGDPALSSSPSRLGSSRAENAQLLLLLESYDRALVASSVTRDGRALRISSEARLLSKRERAALLERVRGQLDATLPPGWSYRITGPLQVYSDMVAELHATQLRSFLAAGLAVAIAIALCLRSAGAVLWAMGPSIVPIVLTLGAMGWVGTPLDVGTAMIAAIVLGIAVDDSVHLIIRYRRHRSAGMRPSAAITWSLEEVGRALVASSLALSAGFLVLLLSSWGGIATFGVLSALAIQLALLADLLLLPALVHCLEPPSAEVLTQVTAPTALRRSWRRGVVWVSAGTLTLLYVQVGIEAQSAPRTAARACATLDNGVLPLAALWSGCERRPYTLQTGAPDPQAAAGAPLPIAAQLATAAFPCLLCLLAAWRSREEAAVPVALCAVALAALAASIALSPHSPTAGRAGVLGLCLLPGAVHHLSLVFPSPRGTLAANASFLRLLYGGVALLSVVALVAYLRFASLYGAVAWLLVGAGALASGNLLLQAQRQARAARSLTERAQAQILGAGASGVAGLAGVLYLLPPAAVLQLAGQRTLLGFTVALSLVPLAHALRRDRLYARAARRTWIRLGIFTGILLVAGFGWGHERSVGSLVLSGLLAFAAVECLDAAMLRPSRRDAGLDPWIPFDATDATGVPWTTESEIGRQLVARVQRALAPRFAAVFFQRPRGFFPAAASDSAPTAEEVGSAAFELLEGRELVHLPDRGGLGRRRQALAHTGIETAVALQGDRGRRGVLVLGALPTLLAPRDRLFLTRTARQAASALSWADAAEQLAAARALARRGFLSASLTHDLGKPLTAIWAAARSLRRHREHDSLVVERLHEIQQVADQGLAIIDQLFEKVREEPGGTLPVGELVAMTCRAAQQRHGQAIQVHYGSDLHGVFLETGLAEALGELLSNACRESLPDTPVEVSVRRSGSGSLWIDVVDRGTGMTEAVAARAFEPWFTQRRAEGGRGLGLALSRLLVRQVGGDVEIVDPGGRSGTRVRISVQLPREVETSP